MPSRQRRAGRVFGFGFRNQDVVRAEEEGRPGGDVVGRERGEVGEGYVGAAVRGAPGYGRGLRGGVGAGFEWGGEEGARF